MNRVSDRKTEKKKLKKECKEQYKRSPLFDSFDFTGQLENEIIRDLLKGGQDKIFTGLFKPIRHSEKGKKIKEEIAILKGNLNFTSPKGELICALKIEEEINRIAEEVRKILVDNGFRCIVDKKIYPDEISEEIVRHISYRAFIFWVLKILESTGFDTSLKTPEELTNVDDELSKLIFKITNDPRLTTLLIVLKSYGFIDLSGNMINKYELEEEVKVCNIGNEKKSEIITKLEAMGATKTFEGTVEDFYYDYPDKCNNLEMNGDSTFRLRKKEGYFDGDGNKTTKRYYTIKRKLSKEEKQKLSKLEDDDENKIENRLVDTRICEEKEFEINNLPEFKGIIEAFGLQEKMERRKKKDRVSYYHPGKQEGSQGMKFDFDKYNDNGTHKAKQLVLELEVDKKEKLMPRLEEFGIQNEKEYPRMATGSTNFFKNPITDEIPEKTK